MPACWPPLPWPWAGPGRYHEDGPVRRPALENALDAFTAYTPELARSIREDEERCDHYEDIIGTYLVQLSSHSLSDGESQESTELLKTIGDFERISDHAVNVLESAEELQSKELSFSPAAMAEYQTLARATRRILHLSLDGFRQDDPVQAARVEPLEQVIDTLKGGAAHPPYPAYARRASAASRRALCGWTC